MHIREHVPLSELTTLKVGGTAAYVAECERVEDVEEALRFARERSLPYMAIGGGSNLLATDAGYEGVLLQLHMTDCAFREEGEQVVVTCGAGVGWDALVQDVAERALWGLENLAGIPGTVGAAAVQNIGAYGAMLADVLDTVEAYDAHKDTLVQFTATDCAFGYRDSRFKHEPELIITRVTLRLTKQGVPNTSYKDLLALVEQGALLDTPLRIAEAVRSVRAQKFPDLSTHGTAGSFFLNPVVPAEEADAMAARFPGMPLFPMPEGGVKAPIAWILDYRHGVVDLRDARVGGAYVWPAHALVIATDAGATASDVDALATEIARRVYDATGIVIKREVRSLQ